MIKFIEGGMVVVRAGIEEFVLYRDRDSVMHDKDLKASGGHCCTTA